MAKSSRTTLPKKNVLNHLRIAKSTAELTCEKIIGFHLIKTNKGGTWRLRYTDFAGKRRKLFLGSFKDGTIDHTDAAEFANKHRDGLKAGVDPVANIQHQMKNFDVVE